MTEYLMFTLLPASLTFVISSVFSINSVITRSLQTC